MNKQTLVLAVVVIVLVVLGVWYFGSSAPKQETVTPADNAAAIASDVNSIDLGDISSDFQSLNVDINSL